MLDGPWCIAAYLLDIDIWNIFKDGDEENSKAEYAIGGPTIELLLNSYNKKYNKNYSAEASNNLGYHVDSDVILNASDTLYSLPAEGSGAPGTWLSSPSAGKSNSPFQTYYYMLCISGSSSIFRGEYYSYSYGIRPVVCLKPEIYLKSVDGGYELFKN